MKKMRICLPVLILLLAGLPAIAKDEPSADISVTVLKADNGKPVRNAAVIFHDVDQKGKAAAGGLELKTNSEGQANYSGLPYGTVLIQVIAHGFQTFGDSFEINEGKKEITIKLKRPQEQYSIYTDHPNENAPKNDSVKQDPPK